MSRIFTSLDVSKVILNGVIFKGWSDGEACIFPDEAELAQFIKGADGKMSASSTGEKGGEVTFKFVPNSPTVDFLQTQVEAISYGAGIVWEGLTVFSDGSTVTMEGGALLKAPKGYTLGKGSAKEMAYKFEFERLDFVTTTGTF